MNPVVAGELRGLDFNFVQPLDNGNQQSPRTFNGQKDSHDGRGRNTIKLQGLFSF